MEKTKTLELKCRFCGTKTGEIQVLDKPATIAMRLEHANLTLSEMKKNYKELDNPELNISDAKRNYEKKQVKKEIDLVEAGIESLTQQFNELDGVEDPLHDINNHNLADIRCSACEESHGSYKEMHDEALNEGLTHEQFKEEMEKCGFKKQGFKQKIADRAAKERVKKLKKINTNKAEE